MLTALSVQAQQDLHFFFKDKKTKQALSEAGVQLKDYTTVVVSDSNGHALLQQVPAGNQTIVYRAHGYETQQVILQVPLSNDTVVVVMEQDEEEFEEIIVQTTRSSRRIEDVASRIETISAEEIDEKSNMRPSNVSMLLHESTGIQVQQTSATSANASIRIQGLDGRYTQLLKDGYPNFGNFASGLSILEIPPLDLKQVEVIKGPASTLYGGGAIAGVVNFISKTPEMEPTYNFLLNQSHIGQTNLGAFAAQRFKKWGYTLLALGNLQKAYDVDKDDFSELPDSKDMTLNPKLFFYPSNRTTLQIGNSFTTGIRDGGDMEAIAGKSDADHVYFEKNRTLRNISSAEWKQAFREKDQLTVRSSLSYFNRSIAIPDYTFEGTNTNSYTDANYVHEAGKQTWVWGANFIYDGFKEKMHTPATPRDFTTQTAGLYAQNTWDITSKVQLESGLRTDFVHYGNPLYNKSEAFVLPRISALFKWNEQLSSRIGAGLGYKAPTLFTEQTESIQYRNVAALNGVTSEHSHGATADISYRTSITSDLHFFVNQMFFFTRINNALQLIEEPAGNYYFANSSENVTSTGWETNARLVFRKYFKLFAGYTYTYATAGYLPGNHFITLLPRNKVNLALIYEKERFLKVGFEAYFTDRQYLNDGTRSPSFWELGFMVEKTLGKVALYVNAENFTDTRQSRYKSVVNGSHTNPTFDDIWTHTEGFVLSGGIKVRL
jgi:iron complex outermembrane receptor protein/outer membrane receptor for ferrienterochelin and colicins